MSNPTTNYIVNGVDLATIFMPVAYGNTIDYKTNYKVKGYGDLNTIFASLSSGSSIGYDSSYNVNGVGDLSTIFASYDSSEYYITNTNNDLSYNFISYQNGYSVLTFTIPYNPPTTEYTTGTCDVIFTSDLTINCIVVGGGGTGGGSLGNYTFDVSSCTGGGGAGGEIVITSKTINTGNTYSLQVGSGGTIYDNPGLDGINSFFSDVTASGGNQGQAATNGGTPGAGGISINGGNGGDGVSGYTDVNGNSGGSSSYSSYTTAYGTTYALGGGGGSGACTQSSPSDGYGAAYGGNGVGGDGGVATGPNYLVDGVSYGSGGASAGALTGSYSSYSSGGVGGPGLVILYWPVFFGFKVKNSNQYINYSYSTSNNYCVLTFTCPPPDTFEYTTGTCDIKFTSDLSVNYILVGGGGAGGLGTGFTSGGYSGGGGAGGEIIVNEYGTYLNVTSGTTYSIQVGSGGTLGTLANNGVESFIADFTASGGYSGGDASLNYTDNTGTPGLGGISINGGNGGDGVSGLDEDINGNSGGDSYYDSYITPYGTTYAFSGGGGSGACTTKYGNGSGYGGNGVGGAGGDPTTVTTDASKNGISYGSGGGGGQGIPFSTTYGGLGGSGIVILYWPISTVSNDFFNYFRSTQTNGYTVLTFLNSNTDSISSTNTITFNIPISNVNIVVVGGGGGGGDNFSTSYYSGGGAGAGGSVVQSSVDVTQNTTYTITVGYGGSGGDGVTATNGIQGGTSSFIGGSLNISASGGNSGYSASNGGTGGTGINGNDGGNGGVYSQSSIDSTNGSTGPSLTIANTSYCFGGGGGGGGSYYDLSSNSQGGYGGGGGYNGMGNATQAYTGTGFISWPAGDFTSGVGWTYTGGGGAGANGTGSYQPGQSGSTGLVIISYSTVN